MSILTVDQIAELVTRKEVALYVGDTDLTFRLEVEAEESTGFPWEEYDGLGVVSGWERRKKAPWERVLVTDSGFGLFYDMRATADKARKEGWGLPAGECEGLTKKQIIEKAVERNFQYCKEWAVGNIWYNTVAVSAHVAGEEVGMECLGHVESDTDDQYMQQLVGDLAAMLEAQLVSELANRAKACADILAALPQTATA